jgi:hypothetical protein
VLIHDDDVEVAVVVEVAEGTAARDVASADGRASFVEYASKCAVAAIAEEDSRAFVGKFRINSFDLGVDVASDPKDVRAAVVVEVDDAGSPTDVVALNSDARGLGPILKLAIAKLR